MDANEIQLRAEAVRVRQNLEWCEEQMRKAASQAHAALKEIHDKKLYRFDYDTFEAYCEAKLGMGRNRAYQILNAGNAREILFGQLQDQPEVQKIVQTLPEGAIREVATMVKTEPEKAARAVAQAASSGKVTAKSLRKALGKEEPKTICPHCGKTF